MKNKISFVLLLIAIPFISFSQVSQQQKKAEKDFLLQLNTILKQKNMPHHWMHEEAFTVVQPFRIDSNQISVTLKYSSDTSWFIHRMIMPVKSISAIGWDMYAILESNSKDVLLLESMPNTSDLKQVDSLRLFHIGQVENEQLIIKLKKSWEKLAPFYDIDYTAE